MSLKEQLITDMKQAMKAGDKTKLSVVRFLRSEIKNYEIDHGEQDDEGVLSIVAQQAKQIRESIDEYGKGGRADLVEQEEAKLEILKTYLPEQLSDKELQQIIAEVIETTENQQPGPIIGQVMQRVRGQADGSRVAKLVNQVVHED